MCADDGAYDLIVFIFTNLFGNGSRSCHIHYLYIVFIRFLISLSVNIVEITIINVSYGNFVWDTTVELLVDHGLTHNVSARIMLPISAIIYGAFFLFLTMYIITVCISEDSLENFFYMIAIGNVLMLFCNVLLFTFTTVIAVVHGDRVIDLSDFAKKFRTVMFFLSLFDIFHSAIGLRLTFLQRQKIEKKIERPMGKCCCKTNTVDHTDSEV